MFMDTRRIDHDIMPPTFYDRGHKNHTTSPYQRHALLARLRILAITLLKATSDNGHWRNANGTRRDQLEFIERYILCYISSKNQNKRSIPVKKRWLRVLHRPFWPGTVPRPPGAPGLARLLASVYILLSSTYWQILTMLGMMIHTHAHWLRGLRFRPENLHTHQILEKAGH
jgi:hypothetical protein